MDIKVDKSYMIDCFAEFVNTPSPVGYYIGVNKIVEKYAERLGYKVTYDNKSTAYITLLGEDTTKTVMLGAHLDTIGMVVRKITDDGKILVRNLGGVNYYSLDGETIEVITREQKIFTGLITCKSHSTHVFDDARTLPRIEENMIVVLDEKVNSKEEVIKLGIQNGDYVVAKPRYQYTSKGYIKSRYIDDKAAVASLFTALKYLTDNHIKPKYTTLLSFPHYEEIGHGGSYLPAQVSEYVAIDIGLIGPDNVGTEFSVSICTKDFHTPYDFNLTNRLIKNAKAANCNYGVDVFYKYGTDASAAIKSGNNVSFAAFGMPCYCSHGMERTNIESLENTAMLAVSYILDC